MIKMLFLSVALFAPTAMAQSITRTPDMPGKSVVPHTAIIKSPEGQIVGTATTSDNMVYFRDAKGELTGTAKIAPDGTRTIYDPNGKLIGTTTTTGNTATTRDAGGQIISITTREPDGTTTTRDANGKIIAAGKEEQRGQ
jgi:YD repeat-containing protein